MFCPKCGAQVPEGSAFCNKCGAAVSAGAALPPAASPPASEPEQDLWKGRFSSKAQYHWWLLWIFWAAGLLYVWFVVLSADMRQVGAARWITLGAAAVPVALILWSWLTQKISTRYRLTTHRLFKETGILSRDINEIELIRVDDVSVRQNLVQRIFNVGVITVIAPTDATEPHLEIVGIENPIEVKEQIRQQVRKRRERSLHVESL
jgi:uncharacterized membrane protein YdbT with pleckstrin-like domain